MSQETYLKLKNTCAKLMLTIPDDVEGIDVVIASALTRFLTQRQDEALAEWRKKVAQWTTNQADLFRYLRNVTPAKCLAIADGEEIRSQPHQLFSLLSSYWEGVESWPDQGSLEHAIESLEDHYVVFLTLCPLHM